MYDQAVKELKLQSNGIAELRLHTRGLASIPKWEFNLFERATKIRFRIDK
jgi:hypothetical protein